MAHSKIDPRGCKRAHDDAILRRYSLLSLDWISPALTMKKGGIVILLILSKFCRRAFAACKECNLDNVAAADGAANYSRGRGNRHAQNQY